MDNKYTLYRGNNLDNFHSVTDTSVDLVLTDPPYGWSFMGKDWDKALPNPQTWVECFRVLKPGGSAVIMSGSRTDCLWRLCRDIEVAGFDLSQTAMVWVYRSGFPKGQDFSKAYDERVGAEREVVGVGGAGGMGRYNDGNAKQGYRPQTYSNNDTVMLTAPATDTAKELDGWFSKGKVKPALEFLIWARKPNSESTELDNMLKWGVGGVNCGTCMIPYADEADKASATPGGKCTAKPSGHIAEPDAGAEHERIAFDRPELKGRFPANLLQDGCMGYEARHFDIAKWASDNGYHDEWPIAAESGLLQIAKPSKSEKDRGCSGIEASSGSLMHNASGRDSGGKLFCQSCGKRQGACKCEEPDWGYHNPNTRHNNHPTCKPVNLMAYVINFLTKPNATVLDPFAGSGTTLVAAIQSGRYPIGMELEDEYCEIIEARASHASVNENKEQGSLFD